MTQSSELFQVVYIVTHDLLVKVYYTLLVNTVAFFYIYSPTLRKKKLNN